MKALMLSNSRFGSLKVLRRSKHRRKGQGAFWDCFCDCGNECVALASQLHNGLKQSCGCKQKKDFCGQRYGEILVIERLPEKGQRTKYLCTCSCGNEIICDGSKLKKRISCGCKKKKAKPRLAIADVVCNSLFGSYSRNAKNKNLLFRLSQKQFRKKIFDKCYYCGDDPKKVFRKWREEEGCRYNGVDRKDNNKGYTRMNCVTCCSECNYKKGAQHIDEFILWIKKVSNNLNPR